MFSAPRLLATFCALCLTLPCFAQHGAVTRQSNLDEMVAKASTIVEGRILDARVEPHPQFKNLNTVVVRVGVSKTLKGTATRELTFRQFVWDVRDRYNRLGYLPGGEELLLLGPNSQYGLTAPIGLEQGRFQLSTDAAGRKVAVNGRNNVGLFATTDKGQTRLALPRGVKASGPISEQELSTQILNRIKGTSSK
jgi:hypothetical protein